jgi:hypothetical protein
LVPPSAELGRNTSVILWDLTDRAQPRRLGLREHEQARALDEDTLARRRRILGEDHPYTLASASNLARDLAQLGEHEQARALREWIRSQRGA